MGEWLCNLWRYGACLMAPWIIAAMMSANALRRTAIYRWKAAWQKVVVRRMPITQHFIKPYAYTVLLCFVLLWFYHDSWWINGNYLLKLFGVASLALTQSYCKTWDEITYPFPNVNGETCTDRTCLYVQKFHRITNFDMYLAFDWFIASMCHILQHV